MYIRRLLGCCVVVLLSAATLSAAARELADAAMKGNKQAVRALLLRKADENAPQVDGTTALHWAERADDLETAHPVLLKLTSATLSPSSLSQTVISSPHSGLRPSMRRSAFSISRKFRGFRL